MNVKEHLASLLHLSLGFLTAFSLLGPLASADEPAAENASDDAPPPTVNLFDGLRARQLEVRAKGDGEGGMLLAVTNRTKKPLNVVLPPGLVATSTTGQFGGMGGMMGGMGGGMGGMGGGMMGGMGGMGGGMGGGMMGGMGGGMGGGMRGGMMGGRGGMMGGGMNRTMPPMMGMMKLAGIIVRLAGDFDSWDFMSQRLSYMSGFMGGMMGGGMGGGMMGGMGGGMMGGMGGMMGGGMRSIPAAGLPQASLRPERTALLPVNLVSLRGPQRNGRIAFPRKNEPLRIKDISQLTGDKWAQTALRELAAHEAPQAVSQLVLWHVGIGLEWDTIERLSKNWANPYELGLAKSFVKDLREKSGKADSASVARSNLYFALTSRRKPGDVIESGMHDLLENWEFLGLQTVEGIPANPSAPSVAVRVRLDDQIAQVQLAVSDESCSAWKSVGKFHVDLATAEGKHLKPLEITDNLAEQILGHLIDTQIVRRRSSHGSSPYLIRVANATPLVLNALAVGGLANDPLARPAVMVGLSIPPHHAVNIPADKDTVRQLHLYRGMKPVAANLGGL